LPKLHPNQISAKFLAREAGNEGGTELQFMTTGKAAKIFHDRGGGKPEAAANTA